MLKDILVVDDEKDIREIIVDILRSQSISVDEAEDGLDALDKLSQHDYSLILCDISMPKMSGLELVEELIKKNVFGAVVMLTAHADRERIIRALQLGALDYVVKPFEPRSFFKKIHVWLALGRELREVHESAGVPEEVDRIAKKLRMIELYRLKNKILA